jgi:hydroxymethylbilane synthase
MPRNLRLGTRGSRLAMAQAEGIRDRVQSLNPGLEVEIVPIRTSGDKGQRERLGAFVREIQMALLEGEVDLAQHCLKDLPTEPVPGLRLSAYLEREDPRDTLISRGPSLSELPQGAVFGTGSVRRTSQLAAITPSFRYKPLVGNVDTRMRKLIEGEYDAIVLAIAGLKRLGVLENWQDSEYGDLTVRPLDFETMLPAPGQAVIVLETCEDDAETQEFISALHDPATQICADSERRFLRAFGGGCSVPVAAMASSDGTSFKLTGLVASPDGTTVLKRTSTGEPSESMHLAGEMAERMIAAGAADLFQGRIPASGGRNA